MPIAYDVSIFPSERTNLTLSYPRYIRPRCSTFNVQGLEFSILSFAQFRFVFLHILLKAEILPFFSAMPKNLKKILPNVQNFQKMRKN